MNKTNTKFLLAGVIALSLSACKKSVQSESNTKAAEVTQVTGETVTSGTFTGRSKHIMSGGASIVKTASGYALVLAEDFSLDGAPAPVVALVNDETYVAANKIAALKNDKGSQTYALPADFSPTAFNQVMVYCEKASAPLGVAPLSSK